MEFDPTAWLTEAEKQGLKPETRKLFEQVFADPAATKYAGESWLRQSDYSRRQSELQKEREELNSKISAKEEQIVSFEQDLAQWKSTNEKSFDETRTKLERAEQQLNAYADQFKTVTSKLKAGYEEYGIELPKDISFELPVHEAPVLPKAPPPKEDDVDTSKFVTNDRLGDVARIASDLPFVIHDIDAEHQELFGSRLKNTAQLRDLAMKEQKPLREIWERENQVVDRRKQVAQERDDARINKEVEERFARRMSEAFNPQSAKPEHHSSAVLERLNTQKATLQPPAERQDPMRGVRAAVQAFAEGKHKTA